MVFYGFLLPLWPFVSVIDAYLEDFKADLERS